MPSMEFEIPIRSVDQTQLHTEAPAEKVSDMIFQLPRRPANQEVLPKNEQPAPSTTTSETSKALHVDKLAFVHELLLEKSAWYRSAWRKAKAGGEEQIEPDFYFAFSFSTRRLLIGWLRTGKVVPVTAKSDVLSLYSDNDEYSDEAQDFDNACQSESADYTAYDEDDDIDYEYEEGPAADEVHLDLADEYRRMKEAGAHLNPKNEDHAEAFIIGRHFPEHYNRGIRRASQLDTYQLSILFKILHNPSYAADYPDRFVHLFAEILQARLAVNAIHKSDHESLNATAEGENDEFAQLVDLAILADRLQIVESLRSEILKQLNLHHVWRVALGSSYLPNAEVACKAFERLGPRSRICHAIVCMYAREWQYGDRSLRLIRAEGRFSREFLEEVVSVMERFDEVDEEIASEEMDQMEIDG